MVAPGIGTWGGTAQYALAVAHDAPDAPIILVSSKDDEWTNSGYADIASR
jgi:hypothetical protein